MAGLLSFILTVPLFALSANGGSEVDTILGNAEGFFKAMKVKDYTKMWDSITVKSKETIIEDVAKALEKSDDKQYTEGQLTDDFSSCGVNCKAYWKGYLANFNPDTVIEQSKWDIGVIKRGKAEIIVTYKRSEKPAVIKMFKEDGTWKVGLTETFWSRK